MRAIRRLLLAAFAAIPLLAACDDYPTAWKTPNMTALTPRLQPLFEKTKPVCFGRFMVDVPATATVVWGRTSAPLNITVYPSGLDEVKALAQQFIDELRNEKAIYLDDIPLLIAVDDVREPDGKIVTGYDGFEAIAGLKINGYFNLNNDGVVINARTLKPRRELATALVNGMARRMRQRAETEIPSEPGNCIEYAFVADDPDPEKVPRAELVRIGFRLQEFPDAHLSIEIYPSNPHDPESGSLQRQWKRIREDPATPEERKVLAATAFFREGARRIQEWKTGYEVLMRSPDEEGSLSHHDFQLKFYGVPHDPFQPVIKVRFETGVGDNAAGATRASLSDEEAIAVWDRITGTLRIRPTTAAPASGAPGAAAPRVALGELAATGRTCPQAGWWEPTAGSGAASGPRRHIAAGERMPPVLAPGEPSLWQKFRGERPTHRTAAVWRLVDYGDAPGPAPAHEG
ncbi:T6SS immunity protein Tli4 family protein [uncultured Massilia sp.]|uniref:T6SS immunity protein Tli4 family protein n=1 Tax=uncultured Massilia sp. TaxID=169973 RepID=UPI0025D91A6E|nr:T6SS immunity protein Tli4 family protein [uncultured Massilia sp.]